MYDDTLLRQQLQKMLDWEDAHVGFDAAVADIPEELRGTQPAGLPYSPWQLVEHIRVAQRDILDFCRAIDYKELHWPNDYWPRTPEPPSSSAWESSIRQVREDREALQQLAADPTVDLASQVPHGRGQTYLREIILVADHTAYHVGQLVVVRRLLEIWG